MPCRSGSTRAAAYRERCCRRGAGPGLRRGRGREGWREIVGDAGEIVGIDHFGASADAATLFREFGFTPRPSSPPPSARSRQRATGGPPMPQPSRQPTQGEQVLTTTPPTLRPGRASRSGSTTSPAERLTPRQPGRADRDRGRHRGDHEPVDLPGRAEPGRRTTTSRSRELAPPGPSVDDAVFAMTTDDVRAACDLFARSTTPPTASTAGSPSRSTRGWPTTPRRPIEQAKALWPRRPAERADQDPGHPRAGLPAITAVLAEGISVNVTLIFSWSAIAR
jgi:hypothetical protein